MIQIFDITSTFFYPKIVFYQHTKCLFIQVSQNTEICVAQNASARTIADRCEIYTLAFGMLGLTTNKMHSILVPPLS